MHKLKEQGAKGVISECTEVGVLITYTSLPFFDSTEIHAQEVASRFIKR